MDDESRDDELEASYFFWGWSVQPPPCFLFEGSLPHPTQVFFCSRWLFLRREDLFRLELLAEKEIVNILGFEEFVERNVVTVSIHCFEVLDAAGVLALGFRPFQALFVLPVVWCIEVAACGSPSREK